MAHFLSAYSIQRWLESCPQGYLDGTVYGHAPDEEESVAIMASPALHEEAVRLTTALIVGERCALAASSGLINAAPDEASKHFLATQTLDEARHVEVFTRRLIDLGIDPDDVESTIADHANPPLVEFATILLEKVDKKDFVAGIVGQNLILEGMAFTVFELAQAMNERLNPKFAHTLAGTIADERRHVGFGENTIGGLIQRYPERRADLQAMQQEMSFHMLAAFAKAFEHGEAAMVAARALAPEEEVVSVRWHGLDLQTASVDDIRAGLARAVLGEHQQRLARVGLVHRAPS